MDLNENEAKDDPKVSFEDLLTGEDWEWLLNMHIVAIEAMN